jgi:hypothetical protein
MKLATTNKCNFIVPSAQVNKKDVLHDMEDEEVCEYVAELVTEQMGDQEFQLDPQQVMLISAKTALYSRLVMTGKASPEQRVVFAKMAFGNYGYKQATEQKMLDAAHAMFEGSGIPTVEERLLQFLYGHAGRIQLMGTMDDMARNLTQVGVVHPPPFQNRWKRQYLPLL